MTGSPRSRPGASLATRLLLALGGLAVTCATARASLSDGLVAHWELDDASGSTTAADSSVNDNTGTLVNIDPDNDWVAENIGPGALYFNGTDGCVDCGSDPSMFPASAITVAAWINHASGSGDGGIVGCGGGWNDDGYIIWHRAGMLRVELQDVGREKTIVDNPGPADDTWHHVAFTWATNTNTIVTFVDGQQGPNAAIFGGPIGVPSLNLFLGDAPGQGIYFQGMIDDARVYDRALSPSEIQDLYNLGTVAGAPLITSTAPTTVHASYIYSYTVTATGNPTPTFSASGLPAWLTWDAATRTLSGTPGAADVGLAGPIDIVATNGINPDATEQFTIDVLALDLAAGLVGWWELDEPSGSVTAVDSSPNTNDGTNSHPNDMPGAGGVVATAYTFNGTDNCVDTGQPLLSNRASFTMAGWVNPATLPQVGRIGLFGQNDCVEFGFEDADLSMWSAGGGALRIAYPYAAGEWRHVAVVGDGTTIRFYLDGDLAGTSGQPTGNYGDNTGNPFRIGGGGIWDATDNWFDGLIDDVRLYDRALRPYEIQSLHNMNMGAPLAAPSITSTPVTSALAGEVYSYTLAVTGNPTPTIAVTGLPSWLAWEEYTRTLSGTPSVGDIGSSATVTVTATNSEGPDSQEFTIDVLEPDLATGLLGWWKFDETSDATAHDSASPPHDGTLVNDADWTPGQVDGAVDLPNAAQTQYVDDDFVQCGDVDYGTVTAVTLALWMYDRGAGNTMVSHMNRTGGTFHGGYGFRATTTEITADLVDPVAEGLTSFTVPHPGLDAWHHVAFTWDAARAEVTVYKDGQPDASKGWHGVQDLGAGPWGLKFGQTTINAREFDGSLDDIRIYGRALRGEEVEHLYETGLGSRTVTMAATVPAASETGPVAGELTVSRAYPGGGPCTYANLAVNLAVSGSAKPGIDYTALPASVTIPHGSSSVAIPVDPLPDTLAEGNETVIVDIAPGAYTVGAPASDTVTIADDDLPEVTVVASVPGAAEGSTWGEFTVTRTGEADGDLEVTVSLEVDVSSTATPATDYDLSGATYSPVGPTVTIPQGALSATVAVAPANDSVAEIAETVVLDLLADAAYTLGAPATATVTITDDDFPDVTVSATVSAAGEPADDGEFTVTLTGPTLSADFTVDVGFAVSGSATRDEDYELWAGGAHVASGTDVVTVPAGSSSVVVTIDVLDDLIGEGDEDVTLTLVAGTGYLVGAGASAGVLIEDDEPAVTVVATTPAAAEGSPVVDGAFTVTRAVRLPARLNENLTVEFAVAGSAVRGADYDLYVGAVLIPGGTDSFTMPLGDPTVTITVTPLDDALGEGDEDVTFTLVPLAGSLDYFVASPSSDTATISDDEPEVTITASDPSASEPSSPGAFTVTRSGGSALVPLASSLDVPCTVSGAALPGADYAFAPPLPFAIPANEYSVTILVQPVDNDKLEGDESVVVTLDEDPAYGYAVGAPASAAVVIRDDERGGIAGGSGCAAGPSGRAGAGAAWLLVLAALVSRMARAAGRRVTARARGCRTCASRQAVSENTSEEQPGFCSASFKRVCARHMQPGCTIAELSDTA